MSLSEQARIVLHEWVQGESLRKHCYAVAASMRYLAAKRGADPDLWGAVALLHDMDYEKYPALGPGNHPFVGVDYLRQHGWSEEICRAILSHADYSGVSRDSDLEKSLAAVDELSSFVVAVALVKPTKSIHDVDVSSVRKKMKDKAFARAVNREEISHNAEALGVPLEHLIDDVIAALKTSADELGIAGVSA